MEAEKKETGGHASAYLNRWHLRAWKELAEREGMKPWQYAKVVIIGHLVKEGMAPQVDLDRQIEKIQSSKDNPHGNTNVVEATLPSDPEPTPAERRAARRRRRMAR